MASPLIQFKKTPPFLVKGPWEATLTVDFLGEAEPAALSREDALRRFEDVVRSLRDGQFYLETHTAAHEVRVLLPREVFVLSLGGQSARAVNAQFILAKQGMDFDLRFRMPAPDVKGTKVHVQVHCGMTLSEALVGLPMSYDLQAMVRP